MLEKQEQRLILPFLTWQKADRSEILSYIGANQALCLV